MIIMSTMDHIAKHAPPKERRAAIDELTATAESVAAVGARKGGLTPPQRERLSSTLAMLRALDVAQRNQKEP